MTEAERRQTAMHNQYLATIPCDERSAPDGATVGAAILAVGTAILPVLLDIRNALEEQAGITSGEWVNESD